MIKKEMNESEYIGQCAICFGNVHKTTDAYLLATKIFMVWPLEISVSTSPPTPNDNYYCVHLICWQIRQPYQNHELLRIVRANHLQYQWTILRGLRVMCVVLRVI